MAAKHLSPLAPRTCNGGPDSFQGDALARNEITVAVTGGNWHVLNIGTPRPNNVSRHTNCKPRYVAWGAQDLLVLSTLINEEISRR